MKITFFLLFSLFFSTLSAQTLPDSVRQIDEVEVVANFFREIISAEKLSGRQLEVLNSFSVSDAIRYFSGVQLKDYGGVGGLKTVDIRSIGTNHVGIFYDGIAIGNAQNGQVDLGKFSLDNLEEISLYNGQKSAIFQSAKDFSTAAAIYLRSRKPQFSLGKTNNFRATLRTGSFDLINPSFVWERKMSENVNFSFNTEYISSSGKYKFRYEKVLLNGTTAWNTTATRANGDIRALRFEGGLFGTLEEGRWHAKIYYYDSERGIPGAIVNNVLKNSQRQWDRNFFAQSNFQKHFSQKYDFMLNVKFSDDYMHYLNPDTTLMHIDNTFRQQEFYASAANKYQILTNWDIALSVDYQRNTLSSNMCDFRSPERNIALVALATAFEYQGLKMQANVLGNFVFDKMVDNEDFKYNFSPALYASYTPFAPLQIRAFYKRNFRMPTFNDLYYTDIESAVVKLKPETATQYNCGFLYDKHLINSVLQSFSLRADGYFNQITDKIIAVPKGNSQSRWMMINVGYVEVHGIDFSGKIGAKIGQFVQNIGLNYTFQKAQDFSDKTDHSTYGGQIAYIPLHSGSAIFNINYKRWDLNYSFIYVGERYHNSANITANYEQPFYTHDVTINRSFSIKKNNFSIAAEVNNLLNQQYDVILHYRMPGRNFKLILKIKS